MNKRVPVRLPDELFVRLSAAVKGEEMDVSGVIRQALMAHLDDTPPCDDEPHSRGAGHTLH